jgi:hypothetical protein
MRDRGGELQPGRCGAQAPGGGDEGFADGRGCHLPDKYTVVPRGQLRVRHRGGASDVGAGQAIVARAGEGEYKPSPEK